MSKKAIFLLIAILIGAVSYVFWSQRGARTLNLRNSGVYKADLQIAKIINGTSKEQQIEQWRLDIPNQYIQWKKGRNAIPNKDINDPGFGNPQEIRMSTIVDQETMTLNTNSSRSRQQIFSGSLFFLVQNKSSDKEMRAAGQCLTLDEWHALHGRTSLAPYCKQHMELCRVFMNVDGWKVEIFIDSDLYASPEPYCELVRTFLDDKTVLRDPVD